MVFEMKEKVESFLRNIFLLHFTKMLLSGVPGVVCKNQAWSRLSESNRRPSAYKAGALPTELSRQLNEVATLKASCIFCHAKNELLCVF
jgi:hypothetical protein